MRGGEKRSMDRSKDRAIDENENWRDMNVAVGRFTTRWEDATGVGLIPGSSLTISPLLSRDPTSLRSNM
jgi:hypothetical protein